jgi:hypothetical protein
MATKKKAKKRQGAALAAKRAAIAVEPTRANQKAAKALAAPRAPRPYPEWRVETHDRAEDAAYTFGQDLIVHCRDEAMATVPPKASAETKAAVETAVDCALHNVMDLLEGFWLLRSGPSHRIEYGLQVRVCEESGDVVEAVDLSPARLDLPIGYWKWARERAFR